MVSETELRDRLAVDRTRMANERTLLAYVRTALALVAAGAGLLHFVGTTTANVVGAFFIALGAVTFPLGFWRFHRYRLELGQLGGNQTGSPR